MPRRRGVLALVALLALASPSCGNEVPAGGVAASPRRPPGPRVVHRLDATDLLPADLDLVVRIDLARMRAGLGPDAIEQLLRRSVPGEDQELLREALHRAEVVWVALRASDVDRGDRVVVVEGPLAGIAPDAARWRIQKSEDPKVRFYDREDAPPRGSTARIVAVRDRVLAFVTPVEVASVARVVRDGPDEKRGDPAAEGIVSIDVRAHRLPPDLERRFPSIAAIIAGVDRVRGTATLVDEGARVEADVSARTPEAAERALKFLLAVCDNVSEPRYVAALASARLERVGATVRLRWLVPGKTVLGLLSGEDKPPDAAPQPTP